MVITAPPYCNARISEPHLHNVGDDINEIGYTPEGWLNVYSLHCGYVERIDRNNQWLTLWYEGCYHVRLHDFQAGRRVLWETFDSLAGARKRFAQLERDL